MGGASMSEIMPQQRLLLEWLVMAGNNAVSDTDNGSLLYKTQMECEKLGWIQLSQLGSSFFMAAITASGKSMVRNRRTGERGADSPNRRRSRTS